MMKSSQKNLAKQLSHYACTLRFQDLPSEVIREAKRRVIDSLACAISAFDSAPGRITRKIAEKARAAQGGATLLGTRMKVFPPLASFANGTLIRCWDYNDTYLSKEPAHPSDNLSAVLAVTESESRSGRDLITALVLAYEIQCRLCDAQSLRAKGWDHVTYGAFSVAASAAKLAGLSPNQIVHALGIAGVANVALRQTRVGEISLWKACAFANVARNALVACELAKSGMTGPAPIFEGEKGFERLVSGPIRIGQMGNKKNRFKILKTYIKFYPVEYHAQAAVEAALRLAPRISHLQKIDRIEIHTYEAAVSIIGQDPEKWRPKSRETADHSLPYVVARSLMDEEMTLEQFTDEKICDPKGVRLMKKIRVVEDKKMTREYPAALPCRIRIHEKGREVLEETVDLPRGHFKNSMTDDEVADKFFTLTAPYFPRTRQERTLEMLWKLERLNRLDELVRLLTVKLK